MYVFLDKEEEEVEEQKQHVCTERKKMKNEKNSQTIKRQINPQRKYS